jgi:hypothetical protein
MAVNANTVETYDVTTIPEDLQKAYVSISPTECPFQKLAKRGTADNSLFEWTAVDLAAPDENNRVVEGDDAPAVDAGTLGERRQNYTQLSDKVVSVSSRSNAVKGKPDIQKLGKQLYFKTRELKRDMEKMLLGNVAAASGSSGTASATAGLPAFLRTNTDRGTGGADPTTSGSGGAGYPNAAATDGTLRALTETMLNNLIADCWDQGAEPSTIMVAGRVKQKISSTFTGNATRYKQADDKRLVGAVDVYVSDFGELSVLPNRFQRSRDLFVLDDDHVTIKFLQPLKQAPLAKTGHADRRMLSAEYGLMVDQEAAHGIIADIDPTL